jgi:hypothetical protein
MQAPLLPLEPIAHLASNRPISGAYPKMLVEPEAAYFQLGGLLAEMPDLGSGPITPEIDQWAKRAVALIEQTGALADSIQFKIAIGHLHGALRARNVQVIVSILRRALAEAELDVPPESRGAFLIADNAFDAFAAVRKVLRMAKTDVLLVDPNADARALTDCAVLAPESVTVRLLADKSDYNTSLASAAHYWVQHFGRRPLSVRLAVAGTVEDTLIAIDRATVWALGHAFNKLAKCTHMSLVRLPPDAAAHMIAVYAAIWDTADPL